MSPPERLTLFLDDRDNRSLSSARIKDGLPAADRIRAAVLLWQQRSPATDRSTTAPRTCAARVSPGTPPAGNGKSRSR